MTAEAEPADSNSTTVYGVISFEDGSRVSRERGGQNVVDPGPTAEPGDSIADQMVDSVKIHYLDEE